MYRVEEGGGGDHRQGGCILLLTVCGQQLQDLVQGLQAGLWEERMLQVMIATILLFKTLCWSRQCQTTGIEENVSKSLPTFIDGHLAKDI